MKKSERRGSLKGNRNRVFLPDQIAALQDGNHNREDRDQDDDLDRQKDRVLDQAVGGIKDIAFGIQN